VADLGVTIRTYFVGSVSILCDSISADDWRERLSYLYLQRSKSYARTACIVLCWKSDPTMVSHIMVDGILSVLSSRAVRL
jgi:hypothetical protein